MNPHALYAHWHLKPACLPFHHSPPSYYGEVEPPTEPNLEGT